MLKDLPADVARWQASDRQLKMTGAVLVAAAASAAAPRRERAAGDSTVRFERVTVAYRGAVVLKPLTLEVAAGRDPGADRPLGLGQDHGAARRRRLRPAGQRRIRIGGADVTDLPPYERGLGMVVQNYALFPHMRVEENVAFGLQRAGRAEAS